ncbi:MAG: P27 family phage terminase small subunit [Dehalococcoidia bacterium]|nr:P27 family phage terminase small subunit [Dehalococcoidia bacterium]
MRAPSHLSAPSRAWWRSVTDGYLLEEHHVRLLTLACEAWDRCEQARAVLTTSGLTFEDRFGCPRARPEVAIERDSRVAFARLLRELALDVEPPKDNRPPGISGRGR